ncbi:membrane protein [Salinisphaera orenii YIM 95161]|uniref:Membrane protein n=1 Tax=Salinisphaera orenii YIM 95161 TaxID=1051139 RepID=A0A423Q2Y8_9GAMM|nr:membrane protein [Salinisphaera halophila YIM 95161]
MFRKSDGAGTVAAIPAEDGFFMWADWFLASPQALLAVVASTAAMYAAVLIFARSAGVRSFAEMSAFDIAVTIGIGSTMATTIAAKTPALLQGVLAVLMLYALQLGVSRWRSRSRAAETAVDNTPILLMTHGGRMLPENMRVARVTEDDLRCQLRNANVLDHRNVQAVVMEGTGRINVLHSHAEPTADDIWVLQNVRDYSAG